MEPVSRQRSNRQLTMNRGREYHADYCETGSNESTVTCDGLARFFCCSAASILWKVDGTVNAAATGFIVRIDVTRRSRCWRRTLESLSSEPGALPRGFVVE